MYALKIKQYLLEIYFGLRKFMNCEQLINTHLNICSEEGKLCAVFHNKARFPALQLYASTKQSSCSLQACLSRLIF